MYVWKPSACHGKRNIHARTWNAELNIMSQTYNTKHTVICKKNGMFRVVCFKTTCFVVFWALWTQPTSTIIMLVWVFTRWDTILILVYIHTYPVFARRINIVKPKTYIHTQQRENALRHRRLLKPKTQISCLDQKVCPNLGFCKCFEAFWRACSKLDF